MRKQQGMTLIGMLLAMACVIFGGIVTFRVVPVYISYYSIIQSIKSLNSTPAAELSGDPMQDVTVLRRSISKRLQINGIDELKDDQLSIVPNGEHKFLVKLKYQAVRPLIFNVSLLFDFEDTREVIPGSDS